MESTWAKKFRILTVSLILSGTLNIGLIAAFISLFFQGRTTEFAVDGALGTSSVPEKMFSNAAALQAMAKMGFRELVALLTNRELVEDGYSRRDLAVAALAAYRHFHLEKALGGIPAQKRTVQLGKGDTIDLYPGLTEEQYEAIIRFAYQEKWPLTAKGLFALLQKIPAPRDESLSQAFMLTGEFSALQLLFQKSEAPQEAKTLVDLATEGNWEILERFAKEQAQLLDLSIDKRRRLLLSYLANQSATAAHLLVKTDYAFVLKRMEDRGVLDLLALLQQKSEEAAALCAALSSSPRGDLVQKVAADKLAWLGGTEGGKPIDVSTVTKRFVEPVPVAVLPAPSISPPRYHTVGEGETLWKIARQYKVKVDDIVRINEIEKDRLVPGMTLQIPD